MSKSYWHCPICKGNFDYGENCDCGDAAPIIGVDLSPEVGSSNFDIGNKEENEKEIAFRSLMVAVENMKIAFDRSLPAIVASMETFDKAMLVFEEARKNDECNKQKARITR